MPKTDRPSSTALAVLIGVWLTVCDPKTRWLVSDGLAEFTEVALRALKSPALWVLKIPVFRSFGRNREAAVLPGICTHYVARKQKIFSLVESSAPTRLIVLGAGLDGLAYRMAEKTESIEIDWPASQRVKQRVFGTLPKRNVKLVGADLADPSFALDFEAGEQGRTIVVAEGVLMYLDESCVRHVLRQVANVASTMVFTFMALDATGRPSFGGNPDKVDKMLERMKEPFRWGAERASFDKFLIEEGWVLNAVYGASDGHLPLLEVASGMIHGEWIAHVSRKSD